MIGGRSIVRRMERQVWVPTGAVVTVTITALSAPGHGLAWIFEPTGPRLLTSHKKVQCRLRSQIAFPGLIGGKQMIFCDNKGLVSHERHPRFNGSYLDFLNHLRRLSGHAPFEGEPFFCTGSVTLAAVGQQRCEGPAHHSVPLICSCAPETNWEQRESGDWYCEDCERPIS